MQCTGVRGVSARVHRGYFVWGGKSHIVLHHGTDRRMSRNEMVRMAVSRQVGVHVFSTHISPRGNVIFGGVNESGVLEYPTYQAKHGVIPG